MFGRERALSRSTAIFQTSQNVENKLRADLTLNDDVDGAFVLQHRVGAKQEISSLIFCLPDIQRQAPDASYSCKTRAFVQDRLSAVLRLS
jgi:hypothetical protein